MVITTTKLLLHSLIHCPQITIPWSSDLLHQTQATCHQGNRPECLRHLCERRKPGHTWCFIHNDCVSIKKSQPAIQMTPHAHTLVSWPTEEIVAVGMPVQAVHAALMTSVDPQWMGSLRTPQPQSPVKTATDELKSKPISPDTPDRELVTP